MRFRSANTRIEQLVNDPLIAEDVQHYAEQRATEGWRRGQDRDSDSPPGSAADGLNA